ncbi:MAG: glycoside hydrolase family 5 protein [Ruminococcus sp.]|nr:glycoside hydrolase family 5 protein [Ruminococcus sp.]
MVIMDMKGNIIMHKKAIAILAAVSMTLSFAGCKDNKSDETASSQSSSSSSSEVSEESSDSSSESSAEATEKTTEEPTEEPATVHVSPVETVSSTLGAQLTVNETIQRTDGANTCKFSLSEFIEDGDSIDSFTFIIYSGDGSNIATFKGGCGISVSSDCSAATDEGWYQSADFSASTQGTYGEIKWDVPAEIRDYIASGGEVMFGYWWGNATSIRVDTVVCNYTRTKQLPVDNQIRHEVGRSVNYNDDENTISVPVADFLPEGCMPQSIVFDVSAVGSFGKFTGAFGADSSAGYYQTDDIAVFTDSSSLSLTWILSDEAKEYINEDGTIMLGYWWSEQPTCTLDAINVKYSIGEGGMTDSNKIPQNNNDESSVKEESSEAEKKPEKEETSAKDESSKKEESDSTEKQETSDSSFRSAEEIVEAINVGWNLGNTFDCYDFAGWTSDGETAWGNPKTTAAMIKSVKDAGFNSIRIPVTWGDHMNGNTIDSAWMNRVQEVVDYAYDEGLFVILNMHHDDYTWFTPNDSEYASDSAKLCAIWEQICERYKNYGDRLLFEGMNEPRTVGSANEWNGGTAAERAVINKYEQDFVDTVRASGGNNAKRTLVITSYAASAVDSAINDVVAPSGGNIIISLHYYAPWKFADGQTTQFTSSDKSELDTTFAKLKSKFINSGTPVIIGEFGCVAAASDSVRSEYYQYYISAAKKAGIKCFVWDNGLSSGDSSFGIFNRKGLSWNNTILSGVMNGAK